MFRRASEKFEFVRHGINYCLECYSYRQSTLVEFSETISLDVSPELRADTAGLTLDARLAGRPA